MTAHENVVPPAESVVIGWLTCLPAGTVIRWGDDGAQPAPEVHCGWVDVRPIDFELGLNWVWTIVDPHDEEARDSLTITVDFDVDVWQVYDPSLRTCLDQPTVVTRRAERPSGSELDALEATSVGDRRVVCQGGWTTTSVHAALGDWTRTHTGRDDLEFVFVADAASAMLGGVSNESELYDLGGGVKASGEAFDSLLAAGPDDAAEIIQKVRHLLGH